MTDPEYVYLGREPNCHCIVFVCADMPDMKSRTAKNVAQCIRDGLEVSRISRAEWEELRKVEEFGCKEKLSVRKCRKARLNGRPE